MATSFKFPGWTKNPESRNRSKSNGSSSSNGGSRPRANTAYFQHPLYTMDDDGIIRLKATGKRLDEHEVAAHAEELLNAVVDHVQHTMKTELGFVEAFIPNATASARCNILLSNNYNAARKLLIFVCSSRGLRPGIWSRSLVLRSGLKAGSMLPYIRKAFQDGYGIIVTNPSSNSVVVPDEYGTMQKIAIQNSSTQEEHVQYVWDTYVTPSAARRIYFIAYAYGGVLVKHLLNTRGDQLIRRNGAIAFIESSHRIEDGDKTEVKSILAHRSMYWEGSDEPVLRKLSGDAPYRTGCTCLSAGKADRNHESTNAAYTISAVMTPVFRFLEIRDATTFVQTECTEGSTPSLPEKIPPAMNTPPAIGTEKTCALCGFQFTLFDRRHHCRMCHRAVCNSCSPDRLFLPGSSTAQRVCTECAADGDPRGQMSSTSKHDQPLQKKSNSSRDSLSVEDFDLLKVIGKGAFGKVMLVRKKDVHSSIYAMKVLKKAAVFAKNQVEHTKSERRILRDIDHPFVVRLRYAFQSEDKLYLVMDYYNGGSLFFHLRKARKFNESRSRFYAAQLLLAMSHLHSLNIAYRDLKLENILMDSKGNVALTDFGLSKENVDVPDGAKTFCGTAEYIAPELLKGLPYGKPVDWWGFGTLLFEMMTGQTPFFDRNRKRMFHNILHRDVIFTPTFSKDAQNLLSGLLRRDPAKRLGSGPTGAQEIMDHPFFGSIDWDKLLRKEVEAPFRPQVTNDADTTNVANIFTREVPRDSPVTQQMGSTHRAQAHFEGFTYVGGSEIGET